MNYDGVDIVIYDKERLLVELIRNKRKFSFDFYKEIIENNGYRPEMLTKYLTEMPRIDTSMPILK